jgi:hypothetical protein
LWIRIRIGFGFIDFVDPDPYWESGSRGKKIKNFQWENAFLVIKKKQKNFTTEKVKNSTNYFLKKILMNNTSIFYLI